MKRLFLLFLLFFARVAFAVDPDVTYIVQAVNLDGVAKTFTGSNPTSPCSSAISFYSSGRGFEFTGVKPSSSAIRGSCQCKFRSDDRENACLLFTSEVKCPTGYKIDPAYANWYYENRIPQCVSMCPEDGLVYDETTNSCISKPNCNPRASYDPKTGQCICSNGEPQDVDGFCNDACPKSDTKVDFIVYLGKFSSDSGALEAARSAQGRSFCLNNCLVYAIRNKSIHKSASGDDGMSRYQGVYEGRYAGNLAVCEGPNPDTGGEGDGGEDEPPEEEDKCKNKPGTHWDSSAKTCVCKDGLEPGPEGCKSSGGEGGSGEGGSGEGGSGEGGSGGGGSGGGGSGEGGSGGGGSGGGGSGEGGSGGGGSGGGGSGEGGSGGGGSGGGGSGGGGSGEGGSGGGGSGGGGSGAGGSGGGGSGEGGSGSGEGSETGTGSSDTGSSSSNDGPAEDGGCVGEACVEGEDIPRGDDVTLVFEPDTVFPDGGSCPAELTFSFVGRSFTPGVMAKMCDFIQWYLRPVAMLLGSILALLIVNGAFRS